jgi:hypothetical protein
MPIQSYLWKTSFMEITRAGGSVCLEEGLSSATEMQIWELHQDCHVIICIALCRVSL